MKKYIIISFISCLFIFNSAAQVNWIWTEQESGTTTTLNNLYFVNNLTGWCVGSGGIILKTNNGGENWIEQVNETTQDLESIHFIDENIGWITGGGVSAEQAPLLKTTDGGENWQLLSFDFMATFVKDIFFINENVGWTITRNSVFRTSDGGITWLDEDYAPGIDLVKLDHRELFATSDTIAYIAGESDNGSNKTMATVFDRRPQNAYLWGTDGLNQFDKDEVLECITFANDSVGFVGGNMGKIYRMLGPDYIPNYTGPWDLNLDLESDKKIRSISFPSSNVGMFNISSNINDISLTEVYHTQNQGESWSSAPDSILGIHGRKLFAPDEKYAWIVGVSGKIYKGEAETPSTIQIHDFALMEVFPNPFNSDVEIILTKPLQDIHINLMNMNGQTIRTKFIKNENRNIKLDNLENLKAGIYILKIYSEQNGFIATQKIGKK